MCPQLTGVHDLFKVSGYQAFVRVVDEESFLVIRAFTHLISPPCIFASMFHFPDGAVIPPEKCVGTRELRIDLDCSFQERHGNSMAFQNPSPPAFAECLPSL